MLNANVELNSALVRCPTGHSVGRLFATDCNSQLSSLRKLIWIFLVFYFLIDGFSIFCRNLWCRWPIWKSCFGAFRKRILKFVVLHLVFIALDRTLASNRYTNTNTDTGIYIDTHAPAKHKYLIISLFDGMLLQFVAHVILDVKVKLSLAN